MRCKMRKTLDSRLKAVEQKTATASRFAAIRSAIRKHLYYDELSEPDRTLYCEFIGIDRAVMEHIMLTVAGDLHFILREFEQPTPQELQEIIAEVEEMVNSERC